jgi:hypothetical protein
MRASKLKPVDHNTAFMWHRDRTTNTAAYGGGSALIHLECVGVDVLDVFLILEAGDEDWPATTHARPSNWIFYVQPYGLVCFLYSRPSHIKFHLIITVITMHNSSVTPGPRTLDPIVHINQLELFV